MKFSIDHENDIGDLPWAGAVSNAEEEGVIRYEGRESSLAITATPFSRGSREPNPTPRERPPHGHTRKDPPH